MKDSLVLKLQKKVEFQLWRKQANSWYQKILLEFYGDKRERDRRQNIQTFLNARSPFKLFEFKSKYIQNTKKTDLKFKQNKKLTSFLFEHKQESPTNSCAIKKSEKHKKIRNQRSTMTKTHNWIEKWRERINKMTRMEYAKMLAKKNDFKKQKEMKENEKLTQLKIKWLRNKWIKKWHEK